MSNKFFADISSNNSFFDATSYRKGGSLLVSIKATEGSSFVNPDHHKWVHEAHLQKLAVVHYHFARPGSSPAATQAAFFMHTIQHYLGPFDYVALDHEVHHPGGTHLDVLFASQFHNTVRQLSRYSPVFYTYQSFLEDVGFSLIPGPNKRLWLANYSSTPNLNIKGVQNFARQFTDGVSGPTPHSMPGIGQCDVSTINLKTFAHLFVNQKRSHRGR